MLSAVNLVFTQLLGNILVSWLSVEAVQYLIGVIIFGLIISFVLRLLRRK